MNELLDQIIKYPDLSEEIVFFNFKYPEIKSLLVHFSTLIVATIIFPFTFSEKFIDLKKAHFSQKVLLNISWGFLIFSLLFCGLGLYHNYLTAEIAIKSISKIDSKSFVKMESMIYTFKKTTFTFYMLGIVFMVLSKFLKIKKIG